MNPYKILEEWEFGGESHLAHHIFTPCTPKVQLTEKLTSTRPETSTQNFGHVHGKNFFN
jgi:hypothetical protein